MDIDEYFLNEMKTYLKERNEVTNIEIVDNAFLITISKGNFV